MKRVEDLIKELQALPPEAPIWVAKGSRSNSVPRVEYKNGDVFIS